MDGTRKDRRWMIDSLYVVLKVHEYFIMRIIKALRERLSNAFFVYLLTGLRKADIIFLLYKKCITY